MSDGIVQRGVKQALVDPAILQIEHGFTDGFGECLASCDQIACVLVFPARDHCVQQCLTVPEVVIEPRARQAKAIGQRHDFDSINAGLDQQGQGFIQPHFFRGTRAGSGNLVHSLSIENLTHMSIVMTDM